MAIYPDDIYTEPSEIDVHTLRNLGSLTGMAGIWEGVFNRYDWHWYCN